jgi:hypothetical protein
MIQKTTMKTLLIAAAALGLTAAAHAQNTGAGAPPPAADTGRGLLGQTYVSLGYGYTDLTGTTVNLQGLRFEYNQPLNTGFDLKLGYTDGRTSRYNGDLRSTQQSFDASAVAFVPQTNWGRPYFEVGGGWLWTKNAGVRDNSFLYHLETGVEYQLTPALALTPYVTYVDAPSVAVNNHWNYGIKANYWLSDQWGVSGALGRDNRRDTTYSAGVNFRF